MAKEEPMARMRPVIFCAPMLEIPVKSALLEFTAATVVAVGEVNCLLLRDAVERSHSCIGEAFTTGESDAMAKSMAAAATAVRWKGWVDDLRRRRDGGDGVAIDKPSCNVMLARMRRCGDAAMLIARRVYTARCNTKKERASLVE